MFQDIISAFAEVFGDMANMTLFQIVGIILGAGIIFAGIIALIKKIFG